MSKKSRLPRPVRKPGLMPGTLLIDPSWPKPAIRVIAYGPDHHEEKEIEHRHAMCQVSKKLTLPVCICLPGKMMHYVHQHVQVSLWRWDTLVSTSGAICKMNW